MGVLIGILISIAALVYVFQKIDWTTFKQQLQSIPIWIFLSLFTICFIANAIRGVRYQFLLSLPYDVSLASIYIGLCFNNLLPLRMGEIARGLFVAHRLKISRTRSIATVILERAFDGATVVFMLGISAWMLDIHFLKNVLWLGILIFGGLLGIFCLSIWKEDSLKTLLSKWLPLCAIDILARVLMGFHSLRDFTKLAWILGLSLLTWAVDGSVFGLLIWYLGIPNPFWVGYLCCSVVALSILAPSAPGYVGVIQAAFVFCFTQLGLNASLGFSASVVIHATQFLLTTIIGLWVLFYSHEGMSFLKNVWIQKNAAETNSQL